MLKLKSSPALSVNRSRQIRSKSNQRRRSKSKQKQEKDNHQSKYVKASGALVKAIESYTNQ